MFNDQCVKFVEPAFNSDADTPDVRVSNAALPNASYKRGRTIGADIALEKGISPNVDVSTAFNDERVREVEVRVGSAKQWVVSDLTLTQKLGSLLAANTACAQLMLQPANFVIDDVLVVGDSSFSFKGNNNTTLNLDLALLRAIKVDPSLDVQLQGKSELPIGDPLIVGYKLYKVQARTGTAGTDLTARRIPQQEIDVLKRRTR